MQRGNPDLASKHQSIWMGRCVINKGLAVGGWGLGPKRSGHAGKWAWGQREILRIQGRQNQGPGSGKGISLTLILSLTPSLIEVF